MESFAQLSYNDINAMIRLGQRQELEAYLRRFALDIESAADDDLELAKSRCIMIISMLVFSLLEIGADSAVESLVAKLSFDIHSHRSVSALSSYIENAFRQFLVCTKPQTNRYAEQVVEQAKAIVSTHFSEPITDEWVAEKVHLSRSHFRYLFRAVTGKPFKRYLTEVRLTSARSLLEKTDFSVKEVCRRIGFGDISSFHRAYRAFHGIPPARHRNRVSSL